MRRSFQVGDHFVARSAGQGDPIQGIIFAIDEEYYHVDWGKQRGKKRVPISWVETLRRWTLTYRPGPDTIQEPSEIKGNQHADN